MLAGRAPGSASGRLRWAPLKGDGLMSRVMMLVGAEGATLAETRVDGGSPEAERAAEAQLREEARVSGFTEDEVLGARIAFAGDPPNQP
jgi:hypothetical protein